MAKKKSGKSSKTAHVLNLIANPPQAATQDPIMPELIPQQPQSEEVKLSDSAQFITQTPAQSNVIQSEVIPQSNLTTPQQPLVSPIVDVASSNNDVLSEQILQALTDELEQETKHIVAKSETPAADLTVSVQITEPEVAEAIEVSDEEEIPNAVETTEVVDTTEVSTPEPDLSVDALESAEQTAFRPANETSNQIEQDQQIEEEVIEEPADQVNLVPALKCINVMLELVEEKVPLYMKLFGLCDCPRCTADVKALTLTNLPPRYAVIREGEPLPKLSVYENMYDSVISTQLTRACRTVMKRPHHDPSR
ncbi:MAG: hypothetical protein HFE73_00745 [Firmicutes bacterium]|nr:hypothetical protein [Bacillota bacterium]